MNPVGIYKGKPLFSEKHDHIQVARYLQVKELYFVHIPNEQQGKTQQDINWLRTRKQLGVKAGASDFLIWYPNFILALELKRADKTMKALTKSQKEFLETIKKFPYMRTAVCFGYHDAVKTIDFYLTE